MARNILPYNDAWFEPELLHPFDPLGVHPHDIPAVGVFDEPVVQVCINTKWASHITGMIERLIYRDAWRGTETEIDGAIESIRQVIARMDSAEGKCIMALCCEPTLQRITTEGIYQTSTDGVTWTDQPIADPREQAGQLPVQSGMTPGDVKCKQANSMVAILQEAQHQEKLSLEQGQDLASLVAAIVGILALIGIIGTGGALAPILLGIAAAVIGLTAIEFDAEFTAQRWSDLTCAIYCVIQVDGKLYQGGLNQIMIDIDSIWGGGVGGTWLKGLVNAMGIGGLNNAGSVPSTNNVDCSNCECSYSWEWDLTLSRDNIGAHYTGGFGARGEWIEGRGWHPVYSSSDNRSECGVQFNFGKDASIDYIEFLIESGDHTDFASYSYDPVGGGAGSIVGNFVEAPTGQRVTKWYQSHWGDRAIEVVPMNPMAEAHLGAPAGTQAQLLDIYLQRVRITYNATKQSFERGYKVDGLACPQGQSNCDPT